MSARLTKQQLDARGLVLADIVDQEAKIAAAAKAREIARWIDYAATLETERAAKNAEIAALREALTQAELDMVAALANHEACRDIWAARAGSPAQEEWLRLGGEGRVDDVYTGSPAPEKTTTKQWLESFLQDDSGLPSRVTPYSAFVKATELTPAEGRELMGYDDAAVEAIVKKVPVSHRTSSEEALARISRLRRLKEHLANCAPDPAEAMSPAVQKAMERFHAKLAERREKEAAEAMRARCEAIIRDNCITDTPTGKQFRPRRHNDEHGLFYADAIAALKGNGEGK